MNTKKSFAILGLLVTFDHKDGYLHVVGHPVTVGLTEQEMRDIDRGNTAPQHVNSDTVRNCSDSFGSTQNGLSLDGLCVYSQGHERTCSTYGDKRSLYGWEVCYRDVYSIDLHRAKRMAVTLTTIANRMAKAQDKNGRPLSYGQYLIQVAHAIGATKLVLKRKGETGISNYSEMSLRIEALSHGADCIDSRINDWVEQLNDYAR